MLNDVRLLIDENEALERQLDLAEAKIVALERELSQWRNGAKSFAATRVEQRLAAPVAVTGRG